MTEKDRSGLSGGSPEENYRELIRKYGGYVYAIVMNRLNRTATREDIEDCVSSVFVDIYTALKDGYAEQGSLKSYIGRIADRRAIDTFRRLTYRRNNTANDDELMNLSSEDDVQAETERKLMKKRLWEAVQSLGSPDSDIIIYQYYYNMKPRDIARKLDMTTGAVRKRSQRARKRLSEIMKG